MAAAAISILLAGAAALARIYPSVTEQVDVLARKNSTRALLRVQRGLVEARPASTEWMDLALRKLQILQRLNRREEALEWVSSYAVGSLQPCRSAVLLIREQAWIEKDLGRFEQADNHLLMALKMARGLNDLEDAANIGIRRAFTLSKLNRLDEADQSLDRVQDYLRGRRGNRLYLSYLQYRGLVLAFRNRFEEAAPLFESAIALAREQQQKGQVVFGMINLAWCEYRLGDLKGAEALYEGAMPSAAADDQYLVLGHLGNIHRDERDYPKAADYYRRAAGLARGRRQEYYMLWLGNWAATLCDEGQWSEAEKVNKEAIAAKKNVQGGEGPSFEIINAARIEASNRRVEAAEKLYREVMASKSTDPSAVLEAYSRLADLYVAAGRTEAARRQFEDALKIADERRADLHEDENKLNYLAHLIELNQSYVGFLARRGEKEAAFAAAEASRARLLRDRLNQTAAAATQWQTSQYESAARTANATFLAYWIAPEQSYLWEITGSELRQIPLPGEEEIRELVQRYQKGLEKDGEIDRDSGRRLFDLLLGPVQPSPGGRYVIVPDGPLFGLNLETLPSGPDGRYWIEDATVMVTPSLDVLLSRQAAARANQRMLLVGDADEWDDAFPKLPSAEREMEGIAKAFPSADVLAGAAATPAAFERARPESYSLIHFAAHATANRDAPLDSAIILSREGQKGKLSVRDLLGMHTNADLVTLSACRSAGARTFAGEGQVGLAWAFLQSGASNVIAGLWDVSDYSSPRLMRRLYSGLAEGQSPADALRAAKLELIHDSKYTHPFYWGAFQLYAGAREW